MKSRRLPWLLLALVTTAAFAAFGDAPTDATVPVTAVANVAAVMPTIRALKSRAEIPGQGGDPFSATAPPAPLEPATTTINAVPPAPTFVAPLPWRVIGKQLADEEGWTVFLAHGNATLVVRTGDMLDDNYRVVAIKPPTLTLQHLKRNIRRTLDIGEAKE
jgi:hypothetical protein